jgi:hypothetical protein
VTVLRKATQSATTVVEKVTSLANARPLPNQNPVTDVVKKATSHVNAQTKSLARAVAAVDGAVAVVAVATLAAVVTLEAEAAAAAVAVKSATNVVKLVTLHVTAPRAEELATAVAVGMVVDTAAEAAAVVVVVAAVVRPATPAAASVTCLATAPRARSATTVSSSCPLSSQSLTNNLQAVKLVTSPETVPLRHLASASATSASNLVTSRLLALTRLV